MTQGIKPLREQLLRTGNRRFFYACSSEAVSHAKHTLGLAVSGRSRWRLCRVKFRADELAAHPYQVERSRWAR